MPVSIVAAAKLGNVDISQLRGVKRHRKKGLLVGCNPDVVDFSQWPGLDAEKLRKALDTDCTSLGALGYEADQCFINDSDSAQDKVAAALDGKTHDCVLIGTGVRKLDE